MELTDNELTEIAYPCEWEYTVIGETQQALEQTIQMVANHRSFRITPSRTSKKGRYISLKAHIAVNGDQERRNVFVALKKSDSVKMVI